MRIDPKHFNLFIIICAVITVIVITFSTIRYSQKQVLEFQRNISEIHFDTLVFHSYQQPDSLKFSDLPSKPVMIQFWSTWSEKSKRVNTFLNDYLLESPGLIVVAASVRDGEEQIADYINDVQYDFLFVDGTAFFQQLYVPGIPSQILIDETGQLFDTHIGDGLQDLEIKLKALIDNERIELGKP